MVRANFTDGNNYTEAPGLTQWDYGQVLEIHGLDLPKAVEIHFAIYDCPDDAIIRIGNTIDKVTCVVVPEKIMEQPQDAVAYVYVSDTKSGETVRTVYMPMIPRQKPEAFDAPEDAELFKETIETVNAAADRAELAKSDAETARDVAQSTADETETARAEVEALKSQAQTAAESALLSEQNAKASDTAAQTAQAGAETAEGQAELFAGQAEESKNFVEAAKAVVMELGQKVADDKSNVEQAVSDFEIARQNAFQGIKDAENAALKNIGTGIDDTLTQSGKAAGAKATGDKLDSLKGDISDYVGVTEMEFSDPTLCQYINTGVASGSVIDWSTPSVSSGGTKIKWCAVECTGGDVFRISAKGGNADRAWAFCDIDKKLIINSNIQADVTNLKLIAPQNAKWIIVNDEQDRRSYIGGFVSDKLDGITDNLLNANVNDNSIKMKKLEGVSYTEGINLISGAYSNKVIESNGTFSDSSAYCLYDEAVEVKNGDILYRLNNSSYSFIGAYRADGTFIRSALQSGLSSYIVNFDGYVRLCDSKDLSTLQVWSKTPVTEYVPHETSYDFSDNPLYKACISGLASKYPKLKGKKWLFMGDSITQGINTPVNSSYFAKSIEYSGAIGTNKGIGGSCISNGRFSLQEETSILTLSSITNTSNPHYIDFENYDILTIFAGTNDWGFDIGEPTDFPTTGDSSYGKTVCGSLNVALKNIQMRNPNLKIIVITPMFRSRYNTGDGMNSDDHSLRLTYSEEIFDDNGYYLYDMADKIEELCKLNHVPCFNMYRNLQVTKYNSDTYLADGVHPTLKGSEYLANRICQFVSDNCGL